MKHNGILVHLVVLAASLTGCRQPTVQSVPSGGAGNPKVTVEKPKRKTLQRTTDPRPANIEPFEQTPLFAKIDGYVRKTRTIVGNDGKPVEKELVDIDDRVKQDEVLAELSVPEREAELRQKVALVKQAKAATEQARAGIVRAGGEYDRWKAEHGRISELAKTGSVSQKLVDETQNQLRAADAARRQSDADLVAASARVAVADADVEHVRVLLEYAKIRAPFAGVVTERNVDTGHYARPPQGPTARPLFVVVRMDMVRIFVDIPEFEAPLVHTGNAAFVRIQALGEAELPGQVARTSWVHDATTRSLRTEVDLANSKGNLRPGMYATVRVVLAERPGALVLPATALFRDGGQDFCSCVESDRVIRKPITLGLRIDGEVEIASGLNGDELVVRDNAASLRPGQTVAATTSKQ